MVTAMKTQAKRSHILHEFDPHEQSEVTRDTKPVILSEASRVVLWLNAAKGTEAYKRIVGIHRLIAELVEGYEQGIDQQEDFDRLQQQHRKLNVKLSRYSLCPQSMYFLTQQIWTAPLIARETEGDFQLSYGDPHHGLKLCEAGTAHLLVKLTETRSSHHVRLCEQCRDKWVVAFRSIDRFCSKDCREEFYKNADGYKARKKANQASYRARLKQLPGAKRPK
jgi:hypothetical protein